MFWNNHPDVTRQEKSLEGGSGHMTLKMRLNANIQEAQQRAADLQRVKEILDKNPEIEELLGILRRVSL